MSCHLYGPSLTFTLVSSGMILRTFIANLYTLKRNINAHAIEHSNIAPTDTDLVASLC